MPLYWEQNLPEGTEEEIGEFSELELKHPDFIALVIQRGLERFRILLFEYSGFASPEG